MGGGRSTIRERYLAAVVAALARPVGGDADAALHAFLTLNAGYFLGEWLSAQRHATLVTALAETLDRAGGLSVPADPAHSLQLAQHVRELAEQFGPLPGLAPLIERTATLLPDRPQEWDTALRAASFPTPGEAGAHELLAAHARRRLWELAHPVAGDGGSDVSPELVRSAVRQAADGSPHAIQAAEAALAELAAHPSHDAGYRNALRFALCG